MKKLNKGEWVAVFSGIALLTYIFYSGAIMNLFNPQTEATNNTNNMPQTGYTAEDVVVGTGDVAESGDLVTAHYVGHLTDGRIFDSSLDRNTPLTFTLGVGQVIRGWDEGIAGMRVGGKRILTITPEYGYGNRAIGAIPANSTLVFEVELLGVTKAASSPR
jgi:peptidylprolyl isomerase